MVTYEPCPHVCDRCGKCLDNCCQCTGEDIMAAAAVNAMIKEALDDGAVQ